MKRIIYKLFIECSPLQGYVAHLPHGFITVVLAVYVHWVLALLFGAGYIIFQLNQEKASHKPAHYDLAGWLLGMALAGIFFVLIRFWRC